MYISNRCWPIYWCTDHDQRKCPVQVTTNSLDLYIDKTLLKQVAKLYLFPQYHPTWNLVLRSGCIAKKVMQNSFQFRWKCCQCSQETNGLSETSNTYKVWAVDFVDEIWIKILIITLIQSVCVTHTLLGCIHLNQNF